MQRRQCFIVQKRPLKKLQCFTHSMASSDAYASLMAASRKAAKEKAHERKAKAPCPNCGETFPNKGVLTKHCKYYKHRAKTDLKKPQPKLNFAAPLEFGRSETTYEKRGSKRVHIKKLKVDMTRRHASLQLCFSAEPTQRVRSGVCFRAKPAVKADGSVDPSRSQHANLETDLRQVPTDKVDMNFQPKAWFDTATSLQFTNNFRSQCRSANQEKLLGLDNLNSQCAPQFIHTMRKVKVQLIYTPADCTDLCAVTNAINICSNRCSKRAALTDTERGYETCTWKFESTISR